VLFRSFKVIAMMMLKRFVQLLALTAVSTHATTSRSQSFAPRSLITETKSARDVTQTRGGAFSDTDKKAIAGAAGFIVIDSVIRKLFKSNGIKFPSQLAGCIMLLSTMLISDVIKPGVGDFIFNALTPGAAFLGKWLSVMFVPGLAMLPFAPSVGSGVDVAKVVAVALLGFLFTLSSVAFSVLFLRKAAGTAINAPSIAKLTTTKSAVPAVKPFKEETLQMLLTASVVTGAISIAASRLGNEYATPLNTLFMGFSTVAAYVWGACSLPAAFTKIVHPLIIGTFLTLGVTQLSGWATGTTFLDMLKTYKVGSLDITKAGAGDILLHMLGPAVISFAVSMYSRKKLLKENLFVVLIAVLVSSVGGLFGTAAFVRAIQLGGTNGALVRLSVLSRNVTTALAMAITSILGGDISIATSVVIMTGVTGATYGRSILTAMGIHDPVSRGLAIGASSQGLGVASVISEPDAFPFAAMSMVLTAMSATTLVSIPAVKDALVKLATGV